MPAKVCTTLKTTKCSSWVVQIRTQQIRDGARPPFWKTVKSPYLRNRLTDCDEIWHADANRAPSAEGTLKFRIFEKPRW